MTTAMIVRAVSAMLAIAAAQAPGEPPAPPPAVGVVQTALSESRKAQTVGERFKSVRVLTDMPAELMIPTMSTARWCRRGSCGRARTIR